MPNLNFPTVPYFESKLRICQDMLYVYSMELRRLAVQRKYGAIDQQSYDDTVAAIENDKAHLVAQIRALTQFKPQEMEEAA